MSQSDADAQQQCERLAAPNPLVDPSTQGPGVDFDKIPVAEALPACQKAAHDHSDPRYIALYSVVLRAAQRYPDAIKESKRAASKGSTLAMMNLGELFEYGQGVPQSEVEAMEWYRKAAEAGNAFAMSVVGDKYLNGRGVTESDKDAAEWYQKAANKGMPPAMVNYGYLCEYGLGVTQNYAEAAAWYHKAVDTGVAPFAAFGMAHLGVMYQTGRGVPRSFPDAATWYRKAMEHNYDKAKINLGVLYQYGWGVEKNPNMAMSLYTQAARSKKPDVAAAGARLSSLLRDSMQNTQSSHFVLNSESGTDSASIAGYLGAMMKTLVVVSKASQNNTNAVPDYSVNEDLQQSTKKTNEAYCAASAFGVIDGNSIARGLAGCPF